jgi:hypothetical protein
MATGALIGAGANIVGGALGGKAAKEGAQKAANIQRMSQIEQQARLDAVKDPELKKILLENPELVGQLSAEQLGESAMGDINLDPRLGEARMTALQGLMERGDEGLTAQDKMQYEQLLGGVDAQEKARQATIQSQMAQRGALDSGAQLASQLSSSQGSANNARMQAMQMAADSASQRMNAQAQAGQMAGQMQSQDFGRQAQQAGARDAIAKFNAANRQDVSRQNLQARQSLEDMRAGNVNRQQELEHKRQKDMFDAGMRKATGQNAVTATGSAQQAQTANQAGAGQAQMYSGMGSAIGKLGSIGDTTKTVTKDGNKTTTTNSFKGWWE